MTTQQVNPAQLQQLITRAQQLLATIQEKTPQATARIAAVLDKLPEAVAARVKQDLETLKSLVGQLVNLLTEPLRNPGSPQALWHAASEWTAIGVQANTEAKNTSANALGVSGYWKGAAATGYETTRAAQEKAFAAMDRAVNAMSDSLNAVVVALVTFYAALGASLGALAAAIIGLAITALFVVTIPAAVAGGVAVLAAEIGVIGVLLGGSALAFTNIKAQQTKITGALAQDGIGGKWPEINPEVKVENHWTVKDPKE